VTAAAARAAEHAVARWRQYPAGTALLSELAAAAEAGRSAASDYLATALADLGIADAAADEEGAAPVDAQALARPSAELPAAAKHLVRAWQEQMLGLVQAANVTKRSIARVASFEHEPLALALMVSALGSGATPAQPDGGGDGAAAGQAGGAGVGSGPDDLLSSLLGTARLRDLTARARQDLHDRVAGAFEPEIARFSEVIDAAGVPDDQAPAQLLGASQALEAAR